MIPQHTIRNTFRKSERLSSRHQIEGLFAKGKSKKRGCIRMVYLLTERKQGAAVQVMFSVPKKQFRKAVHRNLLKRRMREAFRLNKSILTDALSGKDKQLCIAFIFMGVKEETFQAIEYNMKQLLSDIQPPLTF